MIYKKWKVLRTQFRRCKLENRCENSNRRLHMQKLHLRATYCWTLFLFDPLGVCPAHVSHSGTHLFTQWAFLEWQFYARHCASHHECKYEIGRDPWAWTWSHKLVAVRVLNSTDRGWLRKNTQVSQETGPCWVSYERKGLRCLQLDPRMQVESGLAWNTEASGGLV